jgi:DNA-binding GntR family transcriptional regulator
MDDVQGLSLADNNPIQVVTMARPANPPTADANPPVEKISATERVTKRGASTRGQINRSTLSERTYEALKERILDQTLPPGTKLNIDALSRELGVSSSPIREALARLEGERLVVSELYSGSSVAPQPTTEWLHQLMDFRQMLEAHCARVGAPLNNRLILGAMKQEFDRMAAVRRIGTQYREYRKFVQADMRFHQAIVDSAENEVMSDAYRSLNAIILQSRLYKNRTGGIERAAEVLAEHRRILEAYEMRDGVLAAQLIAEHLDGGRRRLLDTDTAAAPNVDVDTKEKAPRAIRPSTRARAAVRVG